MSAKATIKVAQTQCLWIQKATILTGSGDFDPAKAAKALQVGLGELARLEVLPLWWVHHQIKHNPYD